MYGLLLEDTPVYLLCAFRHFAEKEHHITRREPANVLLLLTGGILRFSEDGVPVELCAGEYYIQEAGLFQDGPVASDTPSYLYLHFLGHWGEQPPVLPRRGTYDPDRLLPLMRAAAAAQQVGVPLVEKNATLCQILAQLFRVRKQAPEAKLVDAMILRLTEDLRHAPDLAALAEELHFSPNYLIRLFRAVTGTTPHAYLCAARLRQAALLLETTNATAETVALECGFSDYAHFYRAFRQAYGTSPAAYRRQRRS